MIVRNGILFLCALTIGGALCMFLADRYSLLSSWPYNNNDNNDDTLNLDYHTENPHCWQVAETKLPGVHVVVVDYKRHVLLKMDNLDVNGDFGNRLSFYWAARTLADLGGYPFHIRRNKIHVDIPQEQGADSFLRFLPTFVPAKPQRIKELERVLCHCDNALFVFCHECQYGYAGPMTDTTRNDIRNALFYYVADRYNHYGKGNDDNAMEKNQILGEFYQANDWLIYERCQILDFVTHGFGTLSVYDALPTTGNYTIYSLSGREEGLGYLCEELHQIRNDYITSRNPQVTIVKLAQMDRNVDFGRLVHAPNLLLPSAGSSWALWAAIANMGRVVTVKFKRDHNDPTILPSNFEVLWNATVLYNPETHAASAELLGFGHPSYANTTLKGKQMLLDCYRHC